MHSKNAGLFFYPTAGLSLLGHMLGSLFCYPAVGLVAGSISLTAETIHLLYFYATFISKMVVFLV